MSTKRSKTPDFPSAFNALGPDRTALFFDFDGVIADIAELPSSVRVRPEVLNGLTTLAEASGGAVAIVSGREISDLDRFLSPLRLAAAGVHGAERRSADGRRWRDTADESLLQAILAPLLDFSGTKPDLIVERKPFSIALHYRRNPAIGPDCIAFAEDLAAGESGIGVLRGKMVVELKTSDRTKADAIADFMNEAHFLDRIPVFFGDDVTDEDGFGEVNRRGGLSVKIGEGETAAKYRLPDTETFRAWLDIAGGHWSGPIMGRRKVV